MLRTKRAPRETARMAKDQKIRLGIIFGGRSGEHEVSITSAASVINALDPEEFEITVFGITKTGKLANTSEMRAMLPPDVQSRVHLSPALEADGSGMRVSSDLPAETQDSRKIFRKLFFHCCTVPMARTARFKVCSKSRDLPYIGCGVLASAVGMDKDIMKRLFLQAQLPVAPFRAVFTRDLEKDMAFLKQQTADEFGYPMFSKPANLGSSVGICKIHSGKRI